MLENVVELEEHYRVSHSFQCSECHNKFISSKALEVHIEEEHSNFFAAQLSLYPDRPLFECFAGCSMRFISKALRDDHCLQIHHLNKNGRICEDGRKILANIEKSIRNFEPFKPGDARFGADQERMFNPKRKILNAKRVLK